MRIRFIGLTLAATALPVPAFAAAASDAIELHIEERTPIVADSAEFNLVLTGSGESEAAASASLEANRQALLKKLREGGAAPATTSFVPMPASLDQTDGTALAAAQAACEAAQTAANAAAEAAVKRGAARHRPAATCERDTPPPVERQGTLTLGYGDLSQLATVGKITGRLPYLQRFPARPNALRVFARDPLAARKAALVKALSDARTEADAYAAAVGRHVIGIARLGNGKLGDAMIDRLGTFFSEMAIPEMARGGAAPPAPGAVTVTVDYLIVPN